MFTEQTIYKNAKLENNHAMTSKFAMYVNIVMLNDKRMKNWRIIATHNCNSTKKEKQKYTGIPPYVKQ